MLVILTGASGAGKTTIASAVANRMPERWDVFFFDSIGVPPVAQMIRDCGSPEEWQRRTTFAWIAQLSNMLHHDRNVLFDGQMRLSFLNEALSAAAISDYRIFLIDCDEEARRSRLSVERRQPELANETMSDWAAYLRSEAREAGCEIMNTSELSLDDCVSRIAACGN